MKLIHVKDIGSNFYPMYSVEWVAKVNETPWLPECWTQHALTPSKWAARVYLFELWLSHRKDKRRVRVF